MDGIAWIFCDGSGSQDEITLEKHRCMIPMLSQIDLIYRERYIFLHPKGKEYGNKFIENVTARYGKNFLMDYINE